MGKRGFEVVAKYRLTDGDGVKVFVCEVEKGHDC